MSSPAINTVIKIMESLSEEEQDKIAEHLREHIEYIQDLQYQKNWRESLNKSPVQLMATARSAKQQIAECKAQPMDFYKHRLYHDNYYEYSYIHLIKYIHKYGKNRGYIYLIEREGTTLFKIGRTNNLERRLQELQRKCSDNLFIKDYFFSINANIDERILHRELDYCRYRGEWFSYAYIPDTKYDSLYLENHLENFLSLNFSFYSQNERLARVIFKTYQKEILHEFLKCDNNYYYKIMSSSDDHEKDKVQRKYQDELRLVYCGFVISFKALILASIEQQNKLDRMIDFIKNDLPYYIVNLPSADLKLHTFKDVLSDKIMKQARIYRES